MCTYVHIAGDVFAEADESSLLIYVSQTGYTNNKKKEKKEKEKKKEKERKKKKETRPQLSSTLKKFCGETM